MHVRKPVFARRRFFCYDKVFQSESLEKRNLLKRLICTEGEHIKNYMEMLPITFESVQLKQ